MTLSFKPVWSDSMGAKSSCVLVKTPDVRILIDPGVSIMQKSFPASMDKKTGWLRRGEKAVLDASKEAGVVVISHYHYDHFTDFDACLYKGKRLFVKNPNEFINYSQRGRAENFLGNVCEEFGEIELKSILEKNKKKSYPDPMEKMPLAAGQDFGDYGKRREELLEKGRKRFAERADSWNTNMRIPEIKFEDIEIKFPEGKTFKFGKTKLKFSNPLFHGVEYSNLGWVFATMVEYKGKRLMHSSDLCGVYIEDYAEMIVKENPDILILDGPPTYLLPYMMNSINLDRCIRNICNIIKNVDSELILLDHHLPRDSKYMERLKEVYDLAARENKTVTTAAEYLGQGVAALSP